MGQIVPLQPSQTQRCGTNRDSGIEKASLVPFIPVGIVSPLARRRVFHLVAGPLTRSRYLDFVQSAVDEGRCIPLHVQVRHRGAIVCGSICETVEGKSKPFDFYQVKTDSFGLVWAPHTAVRMCGGDPRCVCEAESRGTATASEARRGATALPPLGNTGGTP